MAKYDVLVEIYQGVLGNVEILSHEAAAEKWGKWAKKHHYADYEEFLKALNEDNPDEELRWFPDVETQAVHAQVLEVKEGLGITECPKCHSTELIVHRDLVQRIDVEKEKVVSDSSEEEYKITNIRCGKCGQLVGGIQDLVIFGSAIHELLTEDLEREPTTEEFLKFWNYLDVDIPQFLRDNIKAFGRDQAV